MMAANRGYGFRGATIAFLLVSSFSVPHADAGSLTTQFAANNGQSGNMFDVKTNAKSLQITSFDLNLDPGTYTLQLYKKSGTWVGFGTTPAAWTFVGSLSNITSNGTNIPTPANFPDFNIAANSTTALYLTGTQADVAIFRYTDGTAVGTVAASNADLQILQGAGVSYPFGDSYTPRIWNGTIYYQAVPEPASLAILVMAALAAIAVRRL